MLRSERTLMSSAAAAVPCEGQALALRGPRCVFFRSAGACPPRPPPHPVHPVHPGHPASDAIAIKVLTDLSIVLHRRSIDIKVFQTFFFLILSILSILAILLQTR